MTITSQPITRFNPTTWNGFFRFDQAQLRPAPARLLTLAGQCPTDIDGNLEHAGDVGAQLGAALDNARDLLDAAGMTLADVTRMVVYVTDMDAALGGYSAITERLDAVGATPPATVVEVSRLALPGQAVEIDITAGR